MKTNFSILQSANRLGEVCELTLKKRTEQFVFLLKSLIIFEKEGGSHKETKAVNAINWFEHESRCS